MRTKEEISKDIEDCKRDINDFEEVVSHTIGKLSEFEEELKILFNINTKEEILERAINILWNNGFSIGSIMHLFGLTRKQARGYMGF